MSGAAITRDPVALRASYFYVSYAHSPPLAGTPQVPHDQWVREFFGDLTESVRRLGTRRTGVVPGFFDQEIPLGSDWRALLAHALSNTEVFVPLYSPGYFARSWPGREWAYFERRLIEAGVENPIKRFVPVLWIPLQPGHHPVGFDQALALGAGDGAYAENGLRAMLRLAPYHESYLRIVDRLARQIVDLAENAPVAPSVVRDIDEMPSPFGPPAAPVFAVAVAAPVRSGPAGSNPAAYGATGSAWRPFPADQELSLAEYAATIAEQLGFAVLVADLDQAEGELETSPGVMLVDPWFAAHEAGLEVLRRALFKRPWILPVLVHPADGSPHEEELVQRITMALGESQPGHGDTARQAVARVPSVGSLEDFVALMPFVIAEAERQYLRRGPILRSTVPAGSRPRLRRGDWAGPPADEEEAHD
jgi:FxsC-like protein